MRNTDSTVRFARDLARQNEDEATFCCTRWNKGSRREWEDVSRWIIQSEVSLWQEHEDLEDEDYIDNFLGWCWPVSKSHAPQHQVNGFLFCKYGNCYHEHVTQRLRMASGFFEPVSDADLIERHLCVEYHSNVNMGIQVKVYAPSAHERLEAALNLRAWAQGKFSPEEIEVICGL